MATQKHISLTKNPTPSMMEFELIAKDVFEAIQPSLLEVFTRENQGKRGLMYIDLSQSIQNMEIGDETAIRFCYTSGNTNSQIFRRIPREIRSMVISSDGYENFMCVVVEGWEGMFSFFALRLK